MMKAIIGKKGTGKTKRIIELANQAAENSAGSVVVIEKGDKLRFDISHKARLIDSSEYGIDGCDRLIGFVEGIVAGNYDVSHIFIDSIYKVLGSTEPKNLDVFFKAMEKVKERMDVVIVTTVSDAPEAVSEYIRGFSE